MRTSQYLANLIKWVVLIFAAALAFYLVYPKFIFTKDGSGDSAKAIRQNRITGKVEKFNKSSRHWENADVEGIKDIGKLDVSRMLKPWEYPIRLGDSRSRVHELLGNAARVTEVLEEYPISGVTAWFDSDGRVSKLNFQGSAGEIYAPSNYWIPSERNLMFGLTAKANEGDFRRQFGTPVLEQFERSSAKFRELRIIWRKDGYLIEALFLATDYDEGDKVFAKGSLMWFEVSPGL